MAYIESQENPTHVSPVTDLKLHNILTQDVMTEEIRKDLLNVTQAGLDHYDKFRKEGFVDKSKSLLSDTIHRTNLKTFKSIHSQKKPSQKKKRPEKKSANAQKTVDLTRVRWYDPL